MNTIISNLSCEDLEKKVKEDPQKSVKFALTIILIANRKPLLTNILLFLQY